MKYFLVSLPDNIYDWIKNKAHKINVSMAEVVRQSLTQNKDIKIFTKQPITVKRWTTQEWKDRVRSRDNYTCQICGMKGNDDNTINAHHILPKKLGGKNILENGITLCLTCHRIEHSDKKRKMLTKNVNIAGTVFDV